MSEEVIDAPVEESKPKKAAKAKPSSVTEKARSITLAKMAAKSK